MQAVEAKDEEHIELPPVGRRDHLVEFGASLHGGDILGERRDYLEAPAGCQAFEIRGLVLVAVLSSA
jgi:hypothetical protein